MFIAIQVEGGAGSTTFQHLGDKPQDTPVQFEKGERVEYMRFGAGERFTAKVEASYMALFDQMPIDRGAHVPRHPSGDNQAVWMRKYAVSTHRGNMHIWEHHLLKANPRFPKVEWMLDLFCKPAPSPVALALQAPSEAPPVVTIHPAVRVYTKNWLSYP